MYEIVDNSIDEALAGYCSHIELTIEPGDIICVSDNGRGIPVDIQPQTGKSALEVVFTVLHAGGKFGGGGYKVSGGLHGVGASVVNALSERFQVDVRRDGYHWRQEFSLGDPDYDLRRLEPLGPGDVVGTTITFFASKSIFETTHYNWQTLSTRFREMAFLNKGLTIRLVDERPLSSDELKAQVNGTGLADFEDDAEAHTREVTFRYDDGLIDFVKYLTGTKEKIHPSVIAIDAESADDQLALEVAMQWNSSFTESVHTFANTINTHEGGTHEEGFRAALTKLINDFARKQNLLKDKDDNLSGDDVREGLTAVISIKLSEPQFEGQTKTKLGNTEAKAFVQKIVGDQLTDWLDRNPAQAKRIITKAIDAATARLAARKARETARRKSVFESFSMPEKLKDCTSKDPSISEIFLVEGDSAGGSAVSGRDPERQAILSLRGKILNVEKARLDRALGNAEIQAMISAFGTGIGEDFDVEKARYHKIVLMADADVDGQHITTLLLTLLFRYMRGLIEAGYVYLAMPPLFRLKWSNSPHEYVYSDRERDALLAAGLEEGKRIPKDNGVQRYKGLGEMNAKELWETTMDPETRTLRQVTIDDAAAADEIFSILMGEDVESRRGFIQRNAKDVRFLDI